MSLPTLATAAGKWLWDKYGQKLVKDILSEARDEITERVASRWAAFSWNEAAGKYRQRVADLYGTTRIFGQPRPVPLDDIFTEVYILEQPVAYRRFDIRRLQGMSGPDLDILMDAKRSAGTTVLSRSEAHRLFILGKPGAGKTTFLKHIALEAARGRFDKIPIFVSLKDWAASRGEDDCDILTFIARQFAICNFPDAEPFIKHLLRKTDDAIVLFDGLDEIRQEGQRRASAITAIRDFSRQYERAQVLITCRNAATDYAFERFTYVEIADFTAGQIETFVRKWFGTAREKTDAFLDHLEGGEHRGLRELARTPLLLGLLCLAFEDNLTFPTRHVEVYRDALDALLRRWDASRNISRDEIYRHLSTGRKHQLFARVAAQAFDRGDYFIRRERLERQIAEYLCHLPRADAASSVDVDASAVLKAIEAQHGILVERAHRVYSFAHRTFQEYYTARYTVENAAQGTIVRLLGHCSDARWSEVVRLTASLLDDADLFFEHFLNALDDLLRGDQQLVHFLAWAGRKAEAVNSSYDPVTLRRFYCYLGLARERALASDALHKRMERGTRITIEIKEELDREPVDLARVLIGAPRVVRLSLGEMLNGELDVGNLNVVVTSMPLELDLVQDFGLDRSPELALDFALALARTLDPNRALELAIGYAEELSLDSLQSALSEITVPADSGCRNEWREFEDRLEKLMVEHRDIGHEWHFTNQQLQLLEGYLDAAEVLLECLALAYVTDRSAIKGRLLRPPGCD